MPDDKTTLLTKRFALAAVAHHEALENMDEGRANAQARMIAGLYEALRGEGAAGQAGLLALVDSDTPVVAGMAAVFCLMEHPDRCLDILRRLSQEEGMLGFRASIVVERWEAGEWEHPGKK